jgi:hypothetical protein
MIMIMTTYAVTVKIAIAQVRRVDQLRMRVTQYRVTESVRVAISTRVAKYSRLNVWLRIAGLRVKYRCSRALRIAWVLDECRG